MIFIDAQNFRQRLVEMFQDDQIEYDRFLTRLNNMSAYGSLFPQLVRSCYYDAEPEETEPELVRKQREGLDSLKRKYQFFEIRLGTAKRDGKGKLKQKGVDALIALDMLSKAYENHYEAAILVSGDEDLLE